MEESVNINGINYNINDFDFHPILKDVENIFWFFTISNLALMNLNVQNILKSNETHSIRAMLRKYNEWTNLNIKIDGEKSSSTSNIKEGLVTIGKTMAIITYDYLDCSSYNSEINSSEEFKFLRFIRNGSAHGNKFNLKNENGEWKIEETEIITWSNKRITRELQGKKIFNDFIFYADMFLLANYFSEKLKQIDASKKKISKDIK